MADLPSMLLRRGGDRPPRRTPYYGWKLVYTLAVTETISWGILYYAFSVFIQPIQHEFKWSQAEITGAYSLALLVSGLAGIPIGRLVDSRGTRLIMSLGSILGTLLMVAWSQVQSLAVYYLVWMGIGVSMAAVLYEPAFAVIATWFLRERGKALTVLTLVGGFASVIFIPLAQQLVGWYGWRPALLILSGLLGITTIAPHIALLRRRPSDLGLERDGVTTLDATEAAPAPADLTTREAIADPNLWWMAGAFSLNAFVVVGLTLHLISYLISHNFDTVFAANAAGLVGLMVFPGRILFNVKGERFSRRLVTSIIFVLLAASIFVLQINATLVAVLVFVVLFGMSKGAITPVRAALVAEQYGAQNYGSINGLLLFPSTIARALAPVAVGFLFDQTGSYDLSILVMAVLSVLAVLMLLSANRQPARRLEKITDPAAAK